MIMKKLTILFTAAAFALTSCSELDLYPLTQGSSENWFNSVTEFDMAMNDLYRIVWWNEGTENEWTDDYTLRDNPKDVRGGTMTSETGFVQTWWVNQYKCITRANQVLENLDRGREHGLTDAQLLQYEAEARFVRACRYATLVFHWGDVPFVTKGITLEEAYAMGRTPKAEIIQFIYDELDFAAENLPEVYTSKQRATRGAALSMKARYALWFKNYDLAEQAAKAVIGMNKYKLHKGYGDLFLTHNAEESIFLIPRSRVFNVGLLSGTVDVKNVITRNAGGFGANNPSWQLLAAYECTDGLTIDKSPLFDSHNPFKNRDPRCTATIVEFGTNWLGFEYQTRPDVKKVMNYNTGKMVSNQDNRAIKAAASYNGLNWKKGVDESWLKPNGFTADNDFVAIRYADILLMYAEACIEQNKIDDSVLDAINQVRARAYDVAVTATDKYPAITTTDKKELTRILRRERRVEFAFEYTRYYDIIRWGIAEEVLNTPMCSMLMSPDEVVKKVVNAGHWFWPYTPTFDENDVPDFSKSINAGLVSVLTTGAFKPRQYLWPIPSKEVLINPNIKQNPGW